MRLSSGKISYKCIHYNLRGVNNVYQASFHKTMIMPFTFIYTYTYKHNKQMKNGCNVSGGAFDSHNFLYTFEFLPSFHRFKNKQTTTKKNYVLLHVVGLLTFTNSRFRHFNCTITMIWFAYSFGNNDK